MQRSIHERPVKPYKYGHPSILIVKASTMFTLSKKVALPFLAAASASLMVAAQVPALCCQSLQAFSANAYVWENQCNTYVSDTTCPSVAGPIGLNCTGTEIE
ncbi:hypothetical protein PHLCEN_2v756 [Hermanssonia centrifuga]|uniref:Uncharacterized protein n=1 Tax=Hermanssonia centrifuga TaxID=98765 RepID=A0A2R6S555_9APHY|nr:hypothetical protein PHLCEN_2v756 [Hermanssonia centrifuga]